MKLKEVETVSESSLISNLLPGPPASSFNRCFIFIIREKFFLPFWPAAHFNEWIINARLSNGAKFESCFKEALLSRTGIAFRSLKIGRKLKRMKSFILHFRNESRMSRQCLWFYEKRKMIDFWFPFLYSRRKFEKVKNNSRKLAAIFLATVLGACLIKHANRAWAEVVSVWPNFPTRRCALLN